MPVNHTFCTLKGAFLLSIICSFRADYKYYPRRTKKMLETTKKIILSGTIKTDDMKQETEESKEDK